MKRVFGWISLLLWACGLPLGLYAQTEPELGTVITSEIQEYFDNKVEQIRYHRQNVRVTQPDKVATCDLAVEYLTRNKLVAKGNVRIVNANGSVITCDSLIYTKGSRTALLLGNVVLTDEGKTLYTTQLDYDMKTGQAIYTQGGRIVDGNSTLVSRYGRYDRATKRMFFQGQVDVKGDNGQTLKTDSLEYDTQSRESFFFGQTRIESPDGIMVAKKGRYNTQSGKARFDQRSTLDNGDYTLTGDTVDYDKTTKMGLARGNVVLFTKKDSVTVYGDKADYNGIKGFSLVTGKAIMKSPTQPDTLYLSADTLLTVDINDSTKRKLFAWPKVRIFKSDLQARCDSLVYHMADSVLYFYQDPVLWNGKNQMTADTIRITQKGKRLDQMYMRQNAFSISVDTLGNFNQTKGRNMTASFANNQISRIRVDGNGHTIYFALEGDTVMTGMAKVICSEILIRFEEGKLATVNYMREPDGVFIPPHELLEPEKRLKGFRWRETERPTLASVLGTRFDLNPVKKVESTPPTPTSVPKKNRTSSKKTRSSRKPDKGRGK